MSVLYQPDATNQPTPDTNTPPAAASDSSRPVNLQDNSDPPTVQLLTHTSKTNFYLLAAYSGSR